MGIVILILGAIAGLILVVVVVGALLPAEHTASVTRQVAGTQEEVWAKLVNTEGQLAWRKDLKEIKMISEQPKKWVEKMNMGDIPMVLEVADAPRRMVTKIDSESLPFGGRWTFQLEPDGNATIVKITEDGVVRNPVFKFMSKFIFGHEATMKTYLSNLEASLNKEAK